MRLNVTINLDSLHHDLRGESAALLRRLADLLDHPGQSQINHGVLDGGTLIWGLGLDRGDFHDNPDARVKGAFDKFDA